MAKGRSAPPELRAPAVAAVLAGSSVAAVARQYGIAESTIHSWMKKDGVNYADVRAEKREALEELIAKYLAEALNTLSAQARIARDPEYVTRFSTEQLAILHGVMADKVIRIIEAHAAAQPVEREVPE